MPRWQNHGQWSCKYCLCSRAFLHFMPCVEASRVGQKCSLIFVAPTWQVWTWALIHDIWMTQYRNEISLSRKGSNNIRKAIQQKNIETNFADILFKMRHSYEFSVFHGLWLTGNLLVTSKHFCSETMLAININKSWFITV